MKLIDHIKKIIEKETRFIYKDEHGMYRDDIIPNYDASLDNKDIVKIIESDDPELALEELLEGWYLDDVFESTDNMIKIIMSHLDVEEEVIRDTLSEVFYVGLPIDHFMKQKVYVNIMMDTGDGNYDYVLNSTYPHYNGSSDEEIDDKASILWLTYQQGYGKTALTKVLHYDNDGDAFLNSVRREILNCGSHMNTLTFLVEMTLGQLIELNRLIKLQDRNGHFYDATRNPYCGYVVLDKNTYTGLYDPWSGAGSIFEIELAKDVVLPVKFIRSALPDGEDGHSIAGVYGMNHSAWRDTVKKINSNIR